MNYKFIQQAEIKGKTILLRVDYNVPIKNGIVTNDLRIRKSIPTIKYLIEKEAKQIVICSHLGRPKGKVVEELRLDPIAKALSEILGQHIAKLDDCINITLPDEKIVLLENLRFYEGEKKNDLDFAKALSKFADIYVNDAFGTCHRAHASVSGITKFLPSYGGFIIKKEIEMLNPLIYNPKRPFYSILGCAKISDKIDLVNTLLKKVDKLFLGGAIVFTFFMAKDQTVGKSLVEKEKIPLAKEILEKYEDKIILPQDIVIKKGDEITTVPWNQIPKEGIGLDLGQKTIEMFKKELKKAKTIFWNGPLGKFEEEPFGKATKEITEFLSNLDSIKIAGGGDTASAIEKYNGKFTHISTGGGATLEFLEGKSLPGLKVLKKL